MAYRRTVGRSRRSGSRRRSSFRRPIWVRATHSSVALTGASTSYGAALIPDVEIDPGARLGSTISRVHLTLSISTPVPTSATAVLVGMAVTDVSDFGVNTDPPINPYDNEAGADWMLWRWIPTVNAFPGMGITNLQGGWQIGYEFDVKSKRVIAQQQENLVFVVTSIGVPWSGVNIASSTLLHMS